MIISLMLLLSNTNLLASAVVAPSAGRRQGASGYVISKGPAATLSGFAATAVEAATGPDEWPIAL